MSYKSSMKNWEGLAKRDALWSILTDNSKKDGKWDLKEFYASGEREIADIFSFLEKKGISAADYLQALDFGCGAGRLSRALATRFEHVSGVDASATMVEMATEANRDIGPKINFLLNQTDGLAQLADNQFSFVLTLITLQHIPYPQSLQFIGEFVRILKPGGILVFQVPTQDVRKISVAQRIKSALKIRERLALLGIGKGFHMAMHCVPQEEILTMVKASGGEVVCVVNTNHTDPDFNGNLKILRDGESAAGFISQLFVVRKK